ncbi:hypothetical protein ACFFLG_06470 [Shewanella indica]|uniref:hypothetical protein n=1 Tax=Shewanella indica TaxID=768528 RepID=UPI000C34930E|nr:hypothetical protein [Shewanella indica]GHA97308.1 hypothetical protein GCM10007107_07790 [Shewanella indica]
MLIYYAPGGGLGHLSRALKVLGFIKAQQALVITSPLPLAVDALLPKGIQHISLPTRLQSRAELSAWLKQLLASLNKQQACRLMLIDAFPGGIWGELGDIPLPGKLVYIARLLNWNVYRQRIAHIPRFQQIWFCEWPTPEQELALSNQTGQRFWLPLLGEDKSQDATPKGLEKPKQTLVIHSGSLAEQAMLLEHATKAGEAIDIIAPPRPSADAGFYPLDGNPLDKRALSDFNNKEHKPGLTRLQLYPASDIGWQYQRVICGGGFNLVSEYILHPGALFVPLTRALDLQHLRIDRGLGGFLPPPGLSSVPKDILKRL